MPRKSAQTVEDVFNFEIHVTVFQQLTILCIWKIRLTIVWQTQKLGPWGPTVARVTALRTIWMAVTYFVAEEATIPWKLPSTNVASANLNGVVRSSAKHVQRLSIFILVNDPYCIRFYLFKFVFEQQYYKKYLLFRCVCEQLRRNGVTRLNVIVT